MHSMIVTGRNIAHGHRTATERALLAADISAERALLVKPTDAQLADVLHVSRPYISAAKIVAGDPEARRQVEVSHIPLLTVAKAARPQRKQPEPLDVVKLFDEAPVAVRAACIRKHIDEALALLDEETMPTGNGGTLPLFMHPQN
jgi:hypothetical protein